MRKFFYLLLLLINSTILIGTEAPISSKQLKIQVKITDSKTNLVQLINDKNQLNRFNYFWSQKRVLRKPDIYQWRYQLKIINQSGSSSWVYDPKGYAREISLKQSSVIYQLLPVRAFNHFLTKEK